VAGERDSLACRRGSRRHASREEPCLVGDTLLVQGTWRDLDRHLDDVLDYWRLGLPLLALFGVVAIGLVPVFWPL